MENKRENMDCEGPVEHRLVGRRGGEPQPLGQETDAADRLLVGEFDDGAIGEPHPGHPPGGAGDRPLRPLGELVEPLARFLEQRLARPVGRRPRHPAVVAGGEQCLAVGGEDRGEDAAVVGLDAVRDLAVADLDPAVAEGEDRRLAEEAAGDDIGVEIMGDECRHRVRPGRRRNRPSAPRNRGRGR